VFCLLVFFLRGDGVDVAHSNEPNKMPRNKLDSPKLLCYILLERLFRFLAETRNTGNGIRRERRLADIVWQGYSTEPLEGGTLCRPSRNRRARRAKKKSPNPNEVTTPSALARCSMGIATQWRYMSLQKRCGHGGSNPFNLICWSSRNQNRLEIGDSADCGTIPFFIAGRTIWNY